ncbi:putative Protein pelota [Paratrimastix pyriformis]|uniref:peptidylprolyl isomerase n=1 Tax=Paratrimastix pyriformis TaxID=342808 RepID=A0ABQ8UNS6_9EUKA|nr:putative Protein pelota [Paratrimastix pyriformis]
MRVIRKEIERDGSGTVKLVAEEPEDMWHAYNLISAGDFVECTTLRKVANTNPNAPTTSQRVVPLRLEIQVVNVDFDSDACQMRISGPNQTPSEFVKTGAFHTLELELQKPFVIRKFEWDVFHLERIAEACNPSKSAELAVVVMTEGLAHVCLITESLTHVRARVAMNIPRKNVRQGGAGSHSKAMTRFYDSLLQAMAQNINFEVAKCVVLASPGFTKDDFFSYLVQQAQANEAEYGVFLRNRAKFVMAHASTGHKQALKEILADPNIARLVQDTKASGEVRALNDFYQMLSQDAERATYGPKHVLHAAQLGAVQTLLLADNLLRNSNLATRKTYVGLAQLVRDGGGEVHVFSEMHVSGEQLSQISGIAAILRFPVSDDGIEEAEEQEPEPAATATTPAVALSPPPIDTAPSPVMAAPEAPPAATPPKEEEEEAKPKPKENVLEGFKMGVTKQVLVAPAPGARAPARGQNVTVHCTGMLENGIKFWSTRDPGQNVFSFRIGMGKVIRGWDEGVMGMKIGEKAVLTCTSDYAYGAGGFPAWGIPANATLKFEIELLAIA